MDGCGHFWLKYLSVKHTHSLIWNGIALQHNIVYCGFRYYWFDFVVARNWRNVMYILENILLLFMIDGYQTLEWQRQQATDFSIFKFHSMNLNFCGHVKNQLDNNFPPQYIITTWVVWISFQSIPSHNRMKRCHVSFIAEWKKNNYRKLIHVYVWYPSFHRSDCVHAIFDCSNITRRKNKSHS